MARGAAAPARAARAPRSVRPRRGGSLLRPARGERLSAQAAVTRAGAASVALPGRVLGTPFARAARARTGSLLDTLLSGRGWIALVGLLLAGIVFFNVDLLRMNRDIARTAERTAALGRENARLRRDVAELSASGRIQESAAELGFVLPAPGEVRYLRAHPRTDARRAAKRITAPTPELTATTLPSPELPTTPTTTLPPE